MIVGAGYVGLVTGVGLARVREVRLVDRNPSLIEKLKVGHMPIFEPDLETQFKENLDKLAFFEELDDALADGRPELIFIAVDTPKSSSAASARNGADGNSADLAKVRAVIDQLLDRSGVAAVMKSTVPPGTGAAIVAEAKRRGSDLAYLSCPEFLQEGSALASCKEPDRIIVGRDEPSWASEALRELHADAYPALDESSVKPQYMEMALTNAEMVKHASNLQLASRISYANEIGNLCEELGADVTEVMAGVGADDRIGPSFLDAGIGFGGSCFDKDIRALKSVAKDRAQIDISLVDTVLAINEGQVDRVIGKLERRLGDLEGIRVAILGLAFKPDTSDLRGSRAFPLADGLRSRGATLRAWDPRADAREAAVRNPSSNGSPEWMAEEEVASTALGAIENADAVVVVTGWPEFTEIDWCEAATAMRGRLVIDGRNLLEPEAVREAGLEYEGTGRESRGLFRPLPQATPEG